MDSFLCDEVCAKSGHFLMWNTILNDKHKLYSVLSILYYFDLYFLLPTTFTLKIVLEFSSFIAYKNICIHFLVYSFPSRSSFLFSFGIDSVFGWTPFFIVTFFSPKGNVTMKKWAHAEMQNDVSYYEGIYLYSGCIYTICPYVSGCVCALRICFANFFA